MIEILSEPHSESDNKETFDCFNMIYSFTYFKATHNFYFQGMDSGFGSEEAYNVYDKPWRNDSDISRSIYKGSKKDNYSDDIDTIIKTNRCVI